MACYDFVQQSETRKMKQAKKRRATLRDVAKAAGVGTTTVSRVINGGFRVAPEMLTRIETVIRELNYQPDQAARSIKLGNGRTCTIGLIVPSITDPFFAQLAGVAQSIARRNDYVLILLTSQDNPEQGLQDLRIFHRHRVDGLLVVPPRIQSKALIADLLQLSVPAVAVDRPLIDPSFSSVLCDNYDAAARATKHLIEHGRNRILCLSGDPGLHTMRERSKGYSDAMKAAGLQGMVEVNVYDYGSAERAISAHMTKSGGISGILGLYNLATIEAYEVLQNRGISIPERIALIGFDDFALAATLRPSITVMQQPVEEIGRTATQLLFDQMNGANSPSRRIEIASTLVLRESCGCMSNARTPMKQIKL
jgi:LacI family transcriptional regulator